MQTRTQGLETINRLKERYLEYYADVPIQRYAAMSIGRDEDTIIRWRKADQQFTDSINQAKAEWVRKKVLLTKAEFALERLEKSVFGPKSSVEITAPPSHAYDVEKARAFAEYMKQRAL